MNLIKQGHLSGTIGGFSFLETFNLSPIVDYNAPAIIFGLYNQIDKSVLAKLQSHITIFWGGNDATRIRDCDVSLIKQKNCRNIVATTQTEVLLRKKGLTVEMLPRDASFFKDSTFYPIVKQNKIYSYIPRTHLGYYNKPMVDSLNLGKQLLVGDSRATGVKQKEWGSGEGLKYYSQCYLGLFLCEGAGGGTGIIEMGLCGIKVITNVLNAPNTIQWQTKQDILNIIETEKNTIGTTDTDLAAEVRSWLSPNAEYLKIT